MSIEFFTTTLPQIFMCFFFTFKVSEDSSIRFQLNQFPPQGGRRLNIEFERLGLSFVDYDIHRGKSVKILENAKTHDKMAVWEQSSPPWLHSDSWQEDLKQGDILAIDSFLKMVKKIEKMRLEGEVSDPIKTFETVKISLRFKKL